MRDADGRRFGKPAETGAARWNMTFPDYGI